MTRSTTSEEKPTGSSPGHRTHLVLYAVALTFVYFGRAPEVTENFTERQARDFHVAAVNLAKHADYVAFSLAQLKSGQVDLASVSFLLPSGDIKINVPGADLHKVTVLERHADWQLVEYHYGNTHDSISRYRAFKNRIEPVSYRVTMDMGIFVSAIVMLIAASIVAALVNAVWRAVARRRQHSDAAV